jgi:hypothetical protein
MPRHSFPTRRSSDLAEISKRCKIVDVRDVPALVEWLREFAPRVFPASDAGLKLRRRTEQLDLQFNENAQWESTMELLAEAGASESIQAVAREFLAGKLGETKFVPSDAEVENATGVPRRTVCKQRMLLEAAGADVFAIMPVEGHQRCALASEFTPVFGAWWHRVTRLAAGAAGLAERGLVVGAGAQLVARDLRGEALPADGKEVVAGFGQATVDEAVKVMKAQGVYALGPA